MIFIVCARPHDSTRFKIDNNSLQVKENQESHVKGNQLRRNTWHPCYKKDSNGNPIITHDTSAGTVNYECKGWTTQACGHVIDKYGYAKCQPVLVNSHAGSAVSNFRSSHEKKWRLISVFFFGRLVTSLGRCKQRSLALMG